MPNRNRKGFQYLHLPYKKPRDCFYWTTLPSDIFKPLFKWQQHSNHSNVQLICALGLVCIPLSLLFLKAFSRLTSPTLRKVLYCSACSCGLCFSSCLWLPFLLCLTCFSSPVTQWRFLEGLQCSGHHAPNRDQNGYGAHSLGMSWEWGT